MRKDLLIEGFEFSQKGSHGIRETDADVSISIQKNNRKGGGDEWKYGFAIRGGLYELILEKEEAIRFGLRGSMLYFIPTNKSEGYAFHPCSDKGSTVYCSVVISSFPSLRKFVSRDNRVNAELKFDKRLELYYINLEEVKMSARQE